MKKTLLLFFCVALTTLTAFATVNIKDGGKYRFVCGQYQGATGYLVLGSYHGATPYVYYLNSATEVPADAWWTVKADGYGYTIQNAASGDYLVYAEGRPTNAAGEYLAKGIQLASAVSDDNARWTFTESASGWLVIENVGVPGQYFNLRKDGTYLVGTYEDATTSNSWFQLYDESGESVVSSGESGGGTGGDETGAIEGEAGVTTDGYYWERTGLDQPVVYTTDTNDPVLYRIVNVRSGLFVNATDSDLQQVTSDPTLFYFVQSSSGLNIYSNNGKYVSTYFYKYYEGQLFLSVYDGNTSGSNLWKLGYSPYTGYAGYTVEKLDNLSSTSWNQSAYLYWNDYDLGSSRGVGLWDVDEGSSFIFESTDQRHIDHLLANGVSLPGLQPTGFRAYADSVRLGGKDLVYDTKAKVYYATLPSTVRGGQDYTAPLDVHFTQSADTYSIKINGTAPVDGQITLPAVTCEEPYTMTVHNGAGDEVASAELNFTFLPLVEVNVPSCNGTTYTTGSLRVTYADLAGYDSTVVAAFRYRGATAMSYSKKSYAIKLRDADGNSVDREFFGLRNDNNWILDAMAVDKACMRNRVSTDLWNDFATKPYHRRLGWETKAKSGTRGRFVEVFLNGQYHGIYCMTEKMDRKQLRLKKFVPATETSADTIHGTLFKSAQWSYEVFMGHQMDMKTFPMTTPRSYDNDARSETWASYEVKYPDWEDEKIDWGPLWNAVNFVATSATADFENSVERYFDFPVLKDYYLFIELMLATDNHGKNMFFYNYDKEGKTYKNIIGVAPWDLDGTWGRRWDGSSRLTGAEQNFDDFLWAEEHGNHTLFYRLQNSTYWNWEQLLAERYAELRGGAFQADKLIKRFTDYADLFSESGADSREATRWSGYHNNIHGDVAYISTWINDRLAYLDTQYNYTPVVDGVQTAPADEPFVAAKGGDGCIWLHANRAATVSIYTADGRLVTTHTLSQPTERIDVGQPGVYVVAGQKVIVK